jgi:hypothetical protein
LAFGGVALAAKLSRRLRVGLAAGTAVLLAVQVVAYWRDAEGLIQPVAIESTVGYRAADFLRGQEFDRVYLSGSTQFWSTAFADIAQVGGGFDPGVVNPLIPMLDFGIPFTAGDGERTAMWLRLVGAQAVYVTGPGSPDAFRQEWRDAGKFQGVLTELWREGDTAIYADGASSLAHVIHREHVVQRAPVNVEDLEPVLPLARAIEDASLPRAHLEWMGPGEARIAGNLAAGDLLWVQVTFHPGWRASGNRFIERDALGFMVIDPACSGPCEVTLRFDGGREMQAARAVTWMTLLVGLAWIGYERLRRRAA